MIEQYATWRYRVEDASISFVCAQAGLVLDRCYAPGRDVESLRAPEGHVTWAALFEVSVFWAEQARAIALRYGYGRAGWADPILSSGMQISL